ncbi:MAG: polyprenyl synthetase family protein, partial [Ruminococcus sp.]|nr:polyprenyl synthetase family protein [Ruminococcus sp.]
MEILEKYPPLTEKRLGELMEGVKAEGEERLCKEAMAYSLEAGGKRIRPALVCAFAEMCGGNEAVRAALDPACALEMIHTFSLIHDDLPCMDDDDLRRGKPSCHKRYGEAAALLAGDGLECLAFEVIANAEGLSCESRVELVKVLSKAVGVSGMIGGQTVDIGGKDTFAEGELLRMYSMKTCALIKAACVMGCICGRREDLAPLAEE